MPHKYTTEEVVLRLNEELITCDTSIKRAQTISRGGNDGFAALKEQVRDFLETARLKKDEALDLTEFGSKGEIYPAEVQQRIAHLCRGQEKAFEIIMDLLENSNRSIVFYENQKKQIQGEIEKMKKYEVRPA